MFKRKNVEGKKKMSRKKKWLIWGVAILLFVSLTYSIEDEEKEAEDAPKSQTEAEKKDEPNTEKEKENVEQVSDEQEKADKEKAGKEKAKKEKAEKEKAEKEEKSVEKEKTNDIELDDELLFGEYTVKNIEVEIENDELTLLFDWINQSGKEDISFTALGYFDVHQGDELLDETSGAYNPQENGSLLKKIHNGGTMPVKAVFEIKNDNPIEIKFGATHEMDNTKEKVVIEDWN